MSMYSMGKNRAHDQICCSKQKHSFNGKPPFQRNTVAHQLKTYQLTMAGPHIA